MSRPTLELEPFVASALRAAVPRVVPERSSAPVALTPLAGFRRLPLIQPDLPQRILAWRAALGVTQAQYLGDVHALADRLPQASHALNLCEDLYHFMIAFAAICLRGQTNLLPPSQAHSVIGEIADAYPGCYAVVDRELRHEALIRIVVGDNAAPGGSPSRTNPTLPETHVAALVFTSGSTGAPQAHAKTWRTLVETAKLAAQRFIGTDAAGASIVATVPPQHMYGLETTVMMALAGGCAAYAGRTFFPAELREALAQVPAPRVLITTPIHLRACVPAPRPFAPLHLIISATAPLEPALAALAERAMGAPVQEIYGCTEAGSMASRRTVDTAVWQLYPGMRLSRRDGADAVQGQHLDAPVLLPDVLDDLGDGRFHLRGRSADMIKVGGKRSSLGELTRALLRVPGVQDAVVFVPEPEAGREARPAALVVAPRLSARQIRSALESMIDPVFLPRPLIRLADLPRNAVGKLPRAALLAELERRLA